MHKSLEVKWQKADAAYAKGIGAYIEWGQELAKIKATQEEIAERYDVDQSAVAQAIMVGRDKRIINIINNVTDVTKALPKSTKSLYELTTLDDEGFEELAKSTTRQVDILAYKKRLKAPKVPPKVDRRGLPPGTYEGRDKDAVPPPLHARGLTWATEFLGLKGCREITKESLGILYRGYAAKYHPDKGGNPKRMAELNEARKIMENKLWT